jgi:hypothetical protein
MLRPDAAECYHTPIETFPTPPDPITRDFLAFNGEIIIDHINHERYTYRGKTFDCDWESPNRGREGGWWVIEVESPANRGPQPAGPITNGGLS